MSHRNPPAIWECDRCHASVQGAVDMDTYEELPPKTWLRVVTRSHRYTRGLFPSAQREFLDAKEFDLCNHCTETLREWIAPATNRKDPPANR